MDFVILKHPKDFVLQNFCWCRNSLSMKISLYGKQTEYLSLKFHGILFPIFHGFHTLLVSHVRKRYLIILSGRGEVLCCIIPYQGLGTIDLLRVSFLLVLALNCYKRPSCHCWIHSKEWYTICQLSTDQTFHKFKKIIALLWQQITQRLTHEACHTRGWLTVIMPSADWLWWLSQLEFFAHISQSS